jgi:hypothetical protein
VKRLAVAMVVLVAVAMSRGACAVCGIERLRNEGSEAKSFTGQPIVSIDWQGF